MLDPDGLGCRDFDSVTQGSFEASEGSFHYMVSKYLRSTHYAPRSTTANSSISSLSSPV